MCPKNFKIKLAGKVIEISSQYSYIYDMCRNYVTEEDIDFSIICTQQDIMYERRKAEESFKERENVGIVNDEYLESLAVYRKIALHMVEYNTILFHGSAVALDGVAYLFTAKSGTGKSTHTRLWREQFGNRAVMINDDKPLLEIKEDKVIVYGTPWDGKHHLSNNIAVPLKGICILNRGERNYIESITAREAYPMILKQTFRPAKVEKMKKTFNLLDCMIENTELYQLFCNMEREAAVIAYEGMNT